MEPDNNERQNQLRQSLIDQNTQDGTGNLSTVNATQSIIRAKSINSEAPIPDSTKVKCIARYSKTEQRYVIQQRDIEKLKTFNVTIEDVKVTTNQLEQNRNLRPFDKKQPLLQWLGFRLLTGTSLIMIAYLTLFLIQLALFNIIMLVVAFIQLNKLYHLMIAYEVKREFAYKTKDFKKFIESENKRFYNVDERNIELIGGDYGKWLEFHLPDDRIDDEYDDDTLPAEKFLETSYVQVPKQD